MLHGGSSLLAEMRIERGVDGFDQIAPDEGRHVVGGAERNRYLKRVTGAAIEKCSRERVREHARLGRDKTLHVVNGRATRCGLRSETAARPHAAAPDKCCNCVVDGPKRHCLARSPACSRW